MATAHLKECVKALAHRMHEKPNRLSRDDLDEAVFAALELIDQPWDFAGERDVLIWREGYEQCMQDIVDAIADEWGVSLPADPTREASDGGEPQ
jgi:hypothetical protein